jgi:hypothetical protein
LGTSACFIGVCGHFARHSKIAWLTFAAMREHRSIPGVQAAEGAHNLTENDMYKMIALAIVALSLGATAASAQTYRSQNQDTGYQSCTTDEGYGRRTACDVGGGN